VKGRRVLLAGGAAAIILAVLVIVLYKLQSNPRESHRATMDEVERAVVATSRGEGRIESIICKQSTGRNWSCQLQFADGKRATERVTEYGSAGNLGVETVR
jgi:hypothetical protein